MIVRVICTSDSRSLLISNHTDIVDGYFGNTKDNDNQANEKARVFFWGIKLNASTLPRITGYFWIIPSYGLFKCSFFSTRKCQTFSITHYAYGPYRLVVIVVTRIANAYIVIWLYLLKEE